MLYSSKISTELTYSSLLGDPFFVKIMTRGGMHNEDVHLSWNVIQILVGCAHFGISCCYVKTNLPLRCAYRPRFDLVVIIFVLTLSVKGLLDLDFDRGNES